MNKYIRGILLVCGVTLLNTEYLQAQKTPTVKPSSKPVIKIATSHSPQKIYRNGIQLKIKGFKVKNAALYFDDNTKVPEDNLVDVNQRINLLVTIDSGWAQSDGKVYPGASEIIKLNTGYEVLKSEDLFKSYDEAGVSPEDAKYITIKAVITQLDDKKKYIMVTFRIWDKKGTSEITGSYNFYIK